jgi:hypothetical protein
MATPDIRDRATLPQLTSLDCKNTGSIVQTALDLVGTFQLSARRFSRPGNTHKYDSQYDHKQWSEKWCLHHGNDFIDYRHWRSIATYFSLTTMNLANNKQFRLSLNNG